MKLKRILVAVDALNGRDAAFERGLSLARMFDAELYLLHAVPVNQRFSFRAAERLARKAAMRQRAEDAGVRVHAVEQHGDPAEIIELHANARAIDLVVMGSQTQRRWGRDRSAVAEGVIRRTKVPTLAVASDDHAAPFGFRRVLVAIDRSPGSTEVLRHAIGLTANTGAHLTVMHAVTGVEAAAVHSAVHRKVPEYRTHVIAAARRDLDAVLSEVPAGVDTSVRVATRSPARAILEQAADLDADLVVVGRSRGFKLFGSTALRVLRKHERALLVVPSATARRREQIDRQHAA
jgi:nucleotide-binding universal stress UspA family protein